MSVIVAYPASEQLPDILGDLETLADMNNDTHGYGMSLATIIPTATGLGVLNSTTIMHKELLGRRRYKVTGVVVLVGLPYLTFIPRAIPIPCTVSATSTTGTVGSSQSPCIPGRDSATMCTFSGIADLWRSEQRDLTTGRALPSPSATRLAPALDPRDTLVLLKHAVNAFAREVGTAERDKGEVVRSPGYQALMDTVTLDLTGHGSWVVQGTMSLNVPFVYDPSPP
jgi:hypothetical protein